MTFDFAPDWLLQAVAATEFTSAAPRSVAVSPLAPPPAGAPAHPSVHELAVLVAELFTEGTLSWDQLRTLGGVPELRPFLTDAITATPAARRVARAGK